MATDTISTNDIYMMPTPILDQLEISIWKGLHQADVVLPTFREHFGKPECTRDSKAWHWDALGISMGASERWAFRVIRLPAIEATLAAISPLLKLFPRRPNGKPAAQLRSAEIAWDFPVSYDYDATEAELGRLVASVISANKRAKLRRKPLKKFRKCRDGAINGRSLFYLQSLTEQPDNDDPGQIVCVPSKKAIWRAKIYCKQLSSAEPWCVRFESTLLGQKLEKSIGRTLPSDLTLLSTCLVGLCFDDFFGFEQFDWPAFMEAARRSAAYKKIPFATVEAKAKLFSRAAMHNGLAVAMWQKRAAKTIAESSLGSKSLQNKISAGKFSMPLKSADVLPICTK